MEISQSIAIIFVLYNPTPDDIEHISTIAHNYNGVIVDNSSAVNIEGSRLGYMDYIPLCQNKGIAEAQNVAIEHLNKKDSAKQSKYIIFMDQDSRCSTNYYKDIAEEYRKVKTRMPNLALLGPTVFNKQSGEEYRSIIHSDKSADLGFVPRRDVISSGSCTAIDVLNDVGLNDAKLFIDFVDYEWCWRAESKGYICGITKNVYIEHQVGNKELSIGSYKIIISSPIRYYYQYRNHLLLSRRKYVPLQWKIATGIKHALRLLYLPIVNDDGFAYLKQMYKGIVAGLKIRN